jgi:chromosome segregation ATPase
MQNTIKEVEALKEEIYNSLKEIQNNTIQQMKELNKTFQDLKMEVESLKKTQRWTALEMENLGKRTRVIDASITNRIQGIEERISAAKDTIKDIDTQPRKIRKAKSSYVKTFKKSRTQ